MAKKSNPRRKPLAPRPIESLIHVVRGQKVMVDSDLAVLYGVTTGNLNLAVRRNTGRFPEDFMFELTKQEAGTLLLQNARANTGRGGRRTRKVTPQINRWPGASPTHPAQHAPSVPPVEGNAVCARVAERGDRFSRDGVHMRNPNPVGQVAAA